jgi:hypothetical protein
VARSAKVFWQLEQRLRPLFALVEGRVWDRFFAAMADAPDFEYVMIDSTIVRTHQHAAGKKGGLKLARSGVRAVE